MTITAGGGAAQVTVDVINAMWDQALTKSNAANARISTAIAAVGSAPQLIIPTLDTSYVPAVPPPLPNLDPFQGQATYDAALATQTNLITNSMVNFIATYFPDNGYFTAALAWITRALTTGGTGLSAAWEQQMWERGRSRILSDSMRTEGEAETTWANKRFKVPPGALINQINQIRIATGQKLAEQSRDISIEAMKAEMDNTRLALTTAVDLRMKALAASGDYIRTIMLGPQTAMQLATGLAGVNNDYTRSLVSYYSAQNAALEPRVRLNIADADLKMRGATANLQAQTASADTKAKAGMEAAQMLGTQAAAGLNAIGGRASISGSDSSTVG